MSKYFVEYGALQANAERLIECETSKMPAVKISEDFARRIAYGLNMTEPGANRRVIGDKDLDELDKLADSMIKSSTYGGGILKNIVQDYRNLNKEREEYFKTVRDASGFPLQN